MKMFYKMSCNTHFQCSDLVSDQERKVKRKQRKVPKPCVDLTALAKMEVGN